MTESTLIRGILRGAALAFAIPLLTGCGRGSPPLAEGKSNVLLIVIDTLRADHLGCYGYYRDTSPNMDRLARDGVVFREARSQSPWTRPSMASLLTSTYPITHGIAKERGDGLPEELTTMAEFFSSRGYLTIGYTANPNINRIFGFDQGFMSYIDSHAVFDWMLDIDGIPENAPTGLERFMNAERLTRSVLDEIGRMSVPFYLQVFYMDPHFPYSPPSPFDELFGNGGDVDLYDGEIAYTDREVGRLVDAVRRRFPNTLVVITSDHGEGFSENNDSILDRRHGNFLYDTLMRVPLIIFHPSLERRRIDDRFELVDLFPTIASLLGMKPPDDSEGSPFDGDIRSGERVDKPLIYMETGWRNMRKIGIVSGRWKYIRNLDIDFMNDLNLKQGKKPYFLPEELYDVSGLDIEKTKENLAETYPEATDSLRTLMRNWLEAKPRLVREKSTSRIDTKTEEQLKALGYLGGEDP